MTLEPIFDPIRYITTPMQLAAFTLALITTIIIVLIIKGRI